MSNGSPQTVTANEQRASSTLLTEMSLRLLTTAAAAVAAACEHYRDAVVVGAYVVFACIYVATQLEFEDALPAGYMLFILVPAVGIFLLDDCPMRVRMTAFLVVLVTGISAAVGFGLAVGCILGMMHRLQLVISTPPILLAVLLLRVACRQLKNKVDELERKYYTLDEHGPDLEDMSLCPVCGSIDEPKTNHELWTPFYDAHRRAFRPGLLFNSVSGKYECGLAISGECSAGPFQHSRDLAEHLLGVLWGDGFHCPGCLRSLRRVRCGGGGGG